jgi:cell wall-associated NlpC family hydrolase
MLRKTFVDWPPDHFCCACTEDRTPPPLLDVAVLSQLDDNDPELPRVAIEHPGGAALAMFSRRLGGDLVSEWLSADGLARLLREMTGVDTEDPEPERALIQLADGTVGWCDIGEAQRREVREGDAPVVRALAVGEWRSVSAAALDAMARHAEQLAGEALSYRLGGRELTAGIDCSALVQHLFEAHAGVLLPRHTGDQMKVGRRVARTEIEPGDLIFARTAERNIMHVGLVAPGELVVHACRLDGCVKRESIGSFLSRYRLLRAQRILKTQETDE